MKPQSESASIVMLGSFNPAIFQPSWLALKNLISPSDAQSAEVKLIAPQLAAFKAGGILVEVLQERFMAQADEPQDQVRLRDLAMGVFAILGETPVSRLGLNWTYVFRLEDEKRWHAVGDLLAPKDVWSKVLRGRPGLRTMTIQGGLLEGLRGQLNVKIEPTSAPSVRLELNNDILGPDRDGAVNADTFVELIRKHWDEARTESVRIATEVLGLAGGV
ncbi:MAG: hypothetical protein AMXMBFR34_17770 [Myxococcaceae bacterium]